ncbi:MAG: STAS/SEC14 domain-containing protein [Gammaproteobacteria bacterium]|nr:MAG: STAS/SEC14 domain-containing protein [Gammaproteobacteria bacterium]
MIEPIPGMPDNILAFRAKGSVTAHDYESIFIPAVEAKIKDHSKIRLLYHLGPEFTGFQVGAMWDDAKVGFRHLTAWEKIAVVSDIEWLRHAASFFGFVMPGEVKVFSNEQLADAEAWIKA